MRKKEEKAAKKPAAPRQEIMHRVWADAHTGIDQKEMDDRKDKKECTGCTWTNHGWKHCKKEIRISSIQRRPFKLPVGRSNPLDHESRGWPLWLMIAGERTRSKRAKGHSRGPIWRTTTPEGSKGSTGNGMWVVRLSDLESKYAEVRR